MNTSFPVYTPDTVNQGVPPLGARHRWVLLEGRLHLVLATHRDMVLIRDAAEIARVIVGGQIDSDLSTSGPTPAQLGVTPLASAPLDLPFPDETPHWDEPAATPAASAAPAAPSPYAELLSRIEAAERTGDVKALAELHLELLALNESREITHLDAPTSALDGTLDALERQMGGR